MERVPVKQPARNGRDGDGRRVKKLSALEEMIFIYDAAGERIAQYSVIPNPDTNASYLTTKNPGTPRINIDRTGAVISRHVYHPYGEEIATPERKVGLKYQGHEVSIHAFAESTPRMKA